ncbi:MAG: peptidase S41 [bacterium]|nr:peptidase S41 [bacterium]
MKRAMRMSLVWVWLVPGCVQAQDTDGLQAQRDTAPTAWPATQAVDLPKRGLVDLPRFPSINADGSEVVFSWRGDLWKVPATGGHAVRLTTHRGADLRSAWSPDGNRIAFDSDRNGYRNIWVMNADGTNVRQVTDIDRSCTLAAWGTDGNGHEVVTFSAAIKGDNYRATRPYMCSVNGGDLIRLHGAFGDNPEVSPDGTKVAFTRGGARWSRRHYRGADARDVWVYDRADGSFKELTDWKGNDGRAAWVGNDRLLFISDRNLDSCNVYSLDVTASDGTAKRLTSFDGDDVQDLDVSADGTTAVFMVWDRLFTLALDQPNAVPAALTITANQDEADSYQIRPVKSEVSEAALSPDGKVMAAVAYGDVYIRNVEEKSPTRRVTATHARERNLAWSPDGLKLYFVSDRDGTESIFAATVAMTRKEVKEDFDKAVKPPEEDDNGEAAATQPSETATQPSTQPESDAAAPDADAETDSGDENESAKDEADERDKKKKKKDKKKDLPKELQPDRWQDALTFNVDPVVQTEHHDREPSPSPDGKSLAFRRSRGDLMILDIESGETRRLVEGWDAGLDWRWSPDSRHIAYHQQDMDFNADIWIVTADGSEPAVNVTRHPDEEYNPRWSADGKILSFVSERVNEEFDLWMVYLDQDLESLTPKEREDYYKKAVKKAKKRKPLKIDNPDDEEEDDDKKGDNDNGEDDNNEDNEEDEDKDKDEDEDEDDDEDDEDEEPVELDLEDAYLRLRRVTSLSGSEGNNEMTPAGDRYIFTATIGEAGLFSIKWDGKDRKRLADSASVQQVSLTGDKIVLVKDGRAGTIGPEGKKIEYVDIAEQIRIDLQEQASQKFLEMARILGENFYHPTLKGLDWAGLTKRYHALARQTSTADEFNHVGMRLMGELNGSHLGVYSRDPRSPNARSQGRLGTVHRRVADGFEIVEVVPLSPADTGPLALQAGDVITAVDLEPFRPTDTVESRLTGRGGKETIVSIKRPSDDGETKALNVLITPVGTVGNLKYRAWRRKNAEQVSEWSQGRIGYIHIRAMGQSSLDVFERDLYAAAGGKDGLIIDVRNNGGGWTTDRLLSSIMVRPHAYTIPRGADPDDIGHYPQGRLFIQRYTLPINMLCNEKSFSNAEIISHAFKTLGRGTLVGQETYGAVISTGGTTLIDGTWVRLPFRGWYLPDGTDMENHGAVPDLVVPQTPEDESRQHDAQLRTAVEDLLKRL